jgi:hypothetical protein
MSKQQPVDAISEMRQALSKGDVVVLTGAGVSMAATGGAPAASWTGLLESGIERAVELNGVLPSAWRSLSEEELRTGLESDHLDSVLSVAEKVERSIKAVSMGEFARLVAAEINRYQSGSAERRTIGPAAGKS